MRKVSRAAVNLPKATDQPFGVERAMYLVKLPGGGLSGAMASDPCHAAKS
jgi:hypothetical protein